MKEIERKFLVNKKLWKKEKHSVSHSEQIVQGYLSRTPTHTVRIRITLPANGGIYSQWEKEPAASLTIKSKRKGISRDEFEYHIPISDGRHMLKMCDVVVKKRRHHIVGEDKKRWVVDQFEGLNKGLFVAEIELKSENEKIKLPKWISKEVSYDKRYSNAYLSSHRLEPLLIS